jgi:hypothetical protein
MINHFVNDKSEYKRNIDVLSAYYKDTSTYLSKMSGKPIEECLKYVKSVTSKNGKFPLIDPEVMLLVKNNNGDREKSILKFSEYIEDTISRKDLMAPTFTTYLHPKRKKSLLSLYIDGNLKKRSKLKKESLTAKMAKKMDLHNLRENQQNSTKIKNNALSGAHASNGTPLANKSSHSTLTSVCRSATSYGNANNEKFISGNRHYWCPDIVKANIINIINNVDLSKIESAINKFNIKIPTIEDVVECVKYSTDLYWRNEEESLIIKELISKLTDIERAAFMYCGDLYHIAKINDSFVRTFIDKIISKPDTNISFEEAEKILSDADADLKAYVSLLCKNELKGKTLNDVKEEDKDVYCLVGGHGKIVIETLEEYKDFIKAFFVVNTMPASVANIPNSIRRTALASDTDSTIFTVQEWGKWYTGDYNFTDKASAIGVTITYFTSQSIIHILAMMCGNMGIDKEEIHRLQMKNEYAFPVFVLTPLAKHYYASMSAREGNVYDELEREVKGVGLRSSSCPKEVMSGVHKLMEHIMNETIAGRKLSIEYVYDVIAGYENKIRDSVESGRYEYLTKSRINARDAYKLPHQSAYVYYDLWKEVFADKYGYPDEPPYSAIKVSLYTDNRTALNEWLASIEDRVIAEKLTNWLQAKGKTDISNILLPEQIVAVSGIPKEIILGINIRKLIYSTVKPFYVVLESLGIFMTDDNICRLVSDFHKVK